MPKPVTVKDIEMPRRLRMRPKYKGFPIPFLILVLEDGTPDFRVTDNVKWNRVVRDHLCQLCGHPLGGYIFFIGGKSTHDSRIFYDPAMHQDCARYAFRVCPYLARTEWQYSIKPLPDGGYRVKEVNEVDRVRPAKMGLFRTDGYRVVKVLTQGKVSSQLFVHANPFDQVEWFD